MAIHSRSLHSKNTGTVRSLCLNGWWDFQPIFGEAGACPPRDGWLSEAILVPSFWTKPKDGVRRPGETFYRVRPVEEFTDEDEFLFDTFGYPTAWSKTRSGWLRRTLSLPELRPDRRYFLNLDAVCPRGVVFVNGVRFAEHDHPTLPLSLDVTEALHPGTNELAVLIRDYERDERGRQKVPTGNWIPCGHSGIWQDVHLVERGDAYLDDLVITTSTRRGCLQVEGTVTNTHLRDRHLDLAFRVAAWRRGVEATACETVLEAGTLSLDVSSGGGQTFALEKVWEDALWWSPESPTLYWLICEIQDGDRRVECCCERFGFREVWLDGPDVMLNDHPIHMFSDWGHKTTPFYYTEGWIRQWFGMIRDGNMNHSRLHTHPHPTLILDIADEEGIFITGEAGLHGSGGAQAADCPEYWEAARDHVRRFVHRDRNHPCIVMWSVENEMRWNRDRTDLFQRELPELRKLFHRLDPTRVAYHEGDTSLWNEHELEIVSRHYGKECAGLGWWDRKRPLHSGEMALYHYAGPNNTLHLRGDAVFARLQDVYEAAALDTAHIVAAGRTLGVCNFGPWNYSCLMNPRMESSEIHPEYSDMSAPGVKPLRVAAHVAEFAFWSDGPGYTPGFGFDIQKHAFRPFALIDLSLRGAYFAGDRFRRTVHVVNDTVDDVIGDLVLTLCTGERILAQETLSLDIRRGRQDEMTFDVVLPADCRGPVTWSARFMADDICLDSWERELQVEPRAGAAFAEKISRPLGVYGPGSLRRALDRLGIRASYVPDLTRASLEPIEILLVEQNAVLPGTSMNQDLERFVSGGGRIIVLEQKASLFPALELRDLPVNQAFVRAPHHPVLRDFTDADFAYWGDDPYALPGGNAAVARRLYVKDDGKTMLALLDSGEGGFGHGDLRGTPLFEAEEGQGLILVCQLRLTELVDTHPVAEKILCRLLLQAEGWTPRPLRPPVVASGRADSAGLIEQARSGATVVVDQANDTELASWGQALGVALEGVAVPVYQAVRVVRDPLLDGISNEDTCGITTWTYAPAGNRDTPVGERFLRPVPGLESLLETPTESCLREHFVEMGKTEPLRAHTISRFLHAEKPGRFVVLGRVRVGEGCILFNQFQPAEEVHTGFARFRNRLLANAGMAAAGGLLAGDCVPESGKSRGYPTACHIYRGSADQALMDRFVECTIFANERMPSRPILKTALWEREENAEGTFAAGEQASVFFYYIIQSGIARKNVDQDIGVPNPEALTFLDLLGDGTVQTVVNGVVHDKVNLSRGEGTVPDIGLEAGFNHVLIAWEPAAADSRLSMRWRNIMRQPETAFAFL